MAKHALQSLLDVIRFKKNPIKNLVPQGAQDAVFGTNDQMQQHSILTPNQRLGQNQALQIALEGLQNTPQGLDFGQQQMPSFGGFNGLGGSSGQEGGGFWSGLAGLGGGLLGGYFGGPTGAALGSQAGSSFANWLGSDNKPQGPGNYEEALAQLGGLPDANQLNFAPIREQAVGNFREQGIPEIAKRFGAMGSGGSHRSSSFGQALGSGEQGLRRDLAALEQGANLQNFQANQGARQNQQLAALNLLQGNRNYAQGQQQLGQGQQRINLQSLLGQGELGQGKQKLQLANLLNQQNQYQNLLNTGLRPQFENAFLAGKPGLAQAAGGSLAQMLPYLLLAG